jgi:hypothetical protein
VLCAACTLLEKTHTFSAVVSADSCDVDAASAKMKKIRLILDMRMPPFQLGRGDQKVIHDVLICQGFIRQLVNFDGRRSSWLRNVTTYVLATAGGK